MKRWGWFISILSLLFVMQTSPVRAALNVGTATGDSSAHYFFDDFILNSETSERVSDRYLSASDLVNVIIRYIFLAGAIVFFALIVYSGYKLVFMSDKQKALSSVKQYLTTGVIGLAIMIAAYWIIQIIEVITGLKIL